MSLVDNLSTQSLRTLYLADHRGEEASANKLKKAELKEAVQQAINHTAAKLLIETLTVEQLAKAAKPLRLDEKDKEQGKGKDKPARKSRNVLSKRLMEAIAAEGLSAYLDKVDLEALKSFAERIGLEPKANKAQLIEQIVEEVETVGQQLYLESFSEDVLRDVAYDMELQKDPLATPGKVALIEAILTNKELPKKEKKEKKAVKVSKTKPPLEKGVTYEDVFQHYYLEELTEFAKKNGIKVSGTKKELIKRILAWLDGDKENTLAGTKKTPKRRKRSASGKKRTKKAESKSENGETKEDKVEEEGLNLDALDSYSVAELKKYCEEEQLQVKGSKKQDYIDAILAYNNEDAGQE